MFDEIEKTFCSKVEERVLKTRCGYMDAISELCEELDLEPELVAKYLSKPIIEKIKVEAQSINLLPRGPQLFSEEGA